ncbi:MAG: serine/threonine-protein phosphatase [Phycisphaerae bacterium]|nr:serine/threonine-protein phosphatase [Phycisphaerae bacterium]
MLMTTTGGRRPQRIEVGHGTDLPLVDLSSNSRIPVLMELVDSLSRATAPQQVLDAVIVAMRKAYGPRCYMTLSTRDLPAGHYRISRWLSLDGVEHVRARDQTGGNDKPALSGGVLGSIVSDPAPKLCQGISIKGDPVLGDDLAPFGSMIAVPLIEEGKVVGWTVLLHEDQHGLGVADLEQLILRGNLAGTAMNSVLIANRLREATDWIQHEVDHIASIQRALLPQSLPEIPGLRVASWFDAYDRAGGDYFDLIPLTVGLDGRHLEKNMPWGIMIADAAGHGPAAAVIVAMMHAVLHAREPHVSRPADMLRHLNERLFSRRLGSEFVTVFYATYDPASRVLRYANAGHNPPLLRKTDGTVQPLDRAGGLPLGVTDAVEGEEAVLQLAEGETLLLYTDGISEAAGPSGEQFGIERLEAVLGATAGDPERIVESISASVRRHEAGQKIRDDQTMLALQVQQD